jgi:hypothetical protein
MFSAGGASGEISMVSGMTYRSALQPAERITIEISAARNLVIKLPSIFTPV